MEINTLQNGNSSVLELKGRFDTITSKKLEEHVISLIESGETQIVADCRHLDYACSSALRVFLMALKSLRQKNGQIVLFGLQPQIKEVFDISGFLDLFPIYQNQEEALNYLDNSN